MPISRWSSAKTDTNLSKRDLAHPVDSADPVQGLVAAWRHLGQDPPASIDSCEAFWSWAGPHWQYRPYTA